MTATPTKRTRRPRILRAVLLTCTGLFLLLAVAVYFFDWNYARPHIARLSKKHLNQEIRIEGPLTVKLSMRPRVSAEQVTITSPDGVTEKNLLKVEKISGQIAIWPLLKKQIRLLNASVENGSVHLISKADGTSNWMFKSVEEAKQENAREQKSKTTTEKSSYKFVLLESNVQNISITFNNLVDATIERFRSQMTNDAASSFEGKGTYNKLPASLSGDTSSIDQYMAATAPLGLAFNVTLGDVRAQGTGAIPSDTGGITFTVNGGGKNLQQVLAALGYETNGVIAPFKLFTNIEQSAAGWSLKDIDIDLGQSKATGLVEFLYGTPMKLHIDAKSPELHFADFGVFFPASEAEKLPAADKKAQSEGDTKLYSSEPLATTAFDSLALDIKADVSKFVGSDKAALIKGFNFHLRGEDGILELAPLNLAMEKGSIETTFSYDSRAALKNATTPRTARIHSIFRAVEIGPVAAPFIEDFGLDSKKLGRLNVKDLFVGTFSGVLQAKSEGVSIADLMAHLDGSLDLALRDGRMSAVLVELAGLDLTQTIERLISKNQLINMPCLLVGLDANDGLITSRVILADTTDSNIYGSGKINLAQENFDLRIVTAAKDFSIGSFTTPIEIKGSFTNPKVGLDRSDTLKRLGVAAVFGAVIHPAAALVALVEPGLEDNKNGCQTYAKRLKGLPFNTEAPSH